LNESSITPEQLAKARHLLRLKTVLRAGWSRHDIPEGQVESVADHSYGVALLSLLFCPPELDRAKVLELAVLHDLAEVQTGDLTPHDGVPAEEKRAREVRAAAQLLKELPNTDELLERFDEYLDGASAEARWVKAVDKLEMSLQSLNYEDDFAVELREFRESSAGALRELGVDWLEGDKRSLG
jgi:putative hydrolase of HD superfamily